MTAMARPPDVRRAVCFLFLRDAHIIIIAPVRRCRSTTKYSRKEKITFFTLLCVLKGDREKRIPRHYGKHTGTMKKCVIRLEPPPTIVFSSIIFRGNVTVKNRQFRLIFVYFWTKVFFFSFKFWFIYIKSKCFSETFNN